MKKIREAFSSISHLIGAGLSLLGLIFLLIRAAQYGNIVHWISFSIFGASLILLYLTSGIYHWISGNPKAEKIWRRLDHMMIFVLIAGSYTPFVLVALEGTWKYYFLALVWGLAILGVLSKMFFFNVPRWAYTAMYLILGWLSITVIRPLILALPTGSVVFLVLGGLFYTVGAVFYALKWPNPVPNVFGFHEIWHLFVMAGSAAHFWAVFRYLPTL